MLFHPIQIFCVTPREIGKQLPHPQAAYTHVSGLTYLSHFCCLLFPAGQGEAACLAARCIGRMVEEAGRMLGGLSH